MTERAIVDSSVSCRKVYFYLALICCLSLSSGMILAFWSQDFVFSMMLMALKCRLSIVGLGLIIFLPLLLSAIAVVYSVPCVVYIFAIIDSISFGFTLTGAILGFGTSGWLVLFLLSFSKILITVPRLYFYIECLVKSDNALRILVYTTVLAVFVCLIDYFCVAQIGYNL